MSETSPDHNTPPSNEIACPAAFEPAAATWEAELVSLSRDPHRAITMPCATIRHWGLLHESPWGLRPACDAPPPSLVMGAPPHVFAAREIG